MPIDDENSGAQVPVPIRTALERLVNLARVTVITGRSRRDALANLGFEPQLLIGSHGAEWPPHKKSRNWLIVERCLKWKEQLSGALFYAQGVEIKFQVELLSLHYRKAADPVKALSLINAAIDQLVPSPRRIDGKYIIDLLAMEALTKGEALVAAMDKLGVKRAIYFGDDATDEEVFQLKSADVFSVRIGRDNQTAASYYLNKQPEILGILNSMVGMLEIQQM
jgi:trehalose 6-phosphate phosphatase